MTARLSDPLLHAHFRIEWAQCGASEDDIKRLLEVVEDFTYYNDPWVESYDVELNNDGNLEIFIEEERLGYKVTLYK